jgi:ATP/maltotriose-dependent transcriptional regulator MalT
MTLLGPDTRTHRQTSGSVAYSARQTPSVVARRPEPRRTAVTAPVVDYERALNIRLSEREVQVLMGMARGRSNREVGAELFVTEDTIKTHARRLFTKLGARDRAHAVHRAWELGILRRTAR